MLYGEPYVISHYLQPDFYEKLQRFHILSIFVFIFDMQLKIHNQNYERIDRNNRCLSVFHCHKSRLKYSGGTSQPLKFVVINQKIKKTFVFGFNSTCIKICRLQQLFANVKCRNGPERSAFSNHLLKKVLVKIPGAVCSDCEKLHQFCTETS